LITNDFSDDGTTEIIDSYTENNSDFLFHIQRTHRLGQYTGNGRFNFLHTLTLAKGKYFAILEGDDYWSDPYKLQKQVDYLEANPKCSICTHWVKTKDESGQGIHEDAFSSKDRRNPINKNDLFQNKDGSPHGTAYHPLSWVFRSKLVNHIPKWIYPIRGGDDVLFTEFIQHGYCHCIPEFMGTYRITNKSSWAPIPPMIKTFAQIHFLINVRIHYAHYQSNVNKILENHLINLQNWKINRTDLTKLIKEFFRVFRNDRKSIIPIINFYTKVFLHQFYYNSICFIKIKIGKFRNMYFRNV
jgi:glycosyltransferase involved in cell wall biosynthesis